MIWLFHISFICSFTSGHLGCFYLLVIGQYWYAFIWSRPYFLFSYLYTHKWSYEWNYHKWDYISTLHSVFFCKLQYCLPQQLWDYASPPKTHGFFISPHPYQHFVFWIFWFFRIFIDNILLNVLKWYLIILICISLWSTRCILQFNIYSSHIKS